MATKKDNNLPPIQWSVQGNCLGDASMAASSGNPNPAMKEIPIPSDTTCVSSPGGSAPFGMPIDADLAVYFIKNFLMDFKLYCEQDKALYSKTKTVSKPDGTQFEELTFNEENLDETKFNLLKEQHKKSRRLIKKLVKITYGVAFDRDIMLKILSQPTCEGLRAYLCGRDINGQMHLSMVMVGVDAQGFDLHYNAPDLETTMRKLKSATTLSESTPLITRSLTAEYGSPPPPSETGADHVHIDELEKKLIDERYVLLRMANAKSGELQAAQRPQKGEK